MKNFLTTALEITQDTLLRRIDSLFNNTESVGNIAEPLRGSRNTSPEKKKKKKLWRRLHNKLLGNYGELRARLYLHRRGYVLVGRNIKLGRNEIDIIAHKKNLLVFVEVKTRAEGKGNPFDAIDEKKQIALSRAASRYIERHTARLKYQRIRVIRFDCIAVVTRRLRANITHYENIITL